MVLVGVRKKCTLLGVLWLSTWRSVQTLVGHTGKDLNLYCLFDVMFNHLV